MERHWRSSFSREGVVWREATAAAGVGIEGEACARAQQLREEPARHEAKPSPWATHDSCWTLKAHGVVVKLYLILRQARPHHSTGSSMRLFGKHVFPRQIALFAAG